MEKEEEDDDVFVVAARLELLVLLLLLVAGLTVVPLRCRVAAVDDAVVVFIGLAEGVAEADVVGVVVGVVAVLLRWRVEAASEVGARFRTVVAGFFAVGD